MPVEIVRSINPTLAECNNFWCRDTCIFGQILVHGSLDPGQLNERNLREASTVGTVRKVVAGLEISRYTARIG